MNENANEKWSLLLSDVRFDFAACFHLWLIAFCCSSLFVQFYVKNQNGQMPLVAHFRF